MQPTTQKVNGATGVISPAPALFEPAPRRAETDPILQVSSLNAIVMQADGTQVSIAAEFVLVTPSLAAAWLAGKHQNRKSSERRVASYTRDMLARKWRITNQGIGFDSNGRLIDGEHRLRAVIASGVPSVFLVVRGMPSQNQNAIDANRPRSVADQYAMWRGSDRAKDRAAAAKVMNLLAHGWNAETDVLTYEEQCDLFDKYKVELDWALSTFTRRVGTYGLCSAPTVAAWAYAYGATNEVAKWAEAYLDGAGLERGDPLLALRNHLMAPVLADRSRRGIALRTARALWGKFNGEKLSKLYDSAEGVIGFIRMRGDTVPASWREWTSKPNVRGAEE